jgi:cyclase
MQTLRLVASIVVRGSMHVQSVSFKRYLPLGNPVESAREFDRWGVDEIALILLDDDREANCALVSEVSKAIAVPLAAVGGIRNILDARAYIAGGADKIGFNKSLVENPRLVREAARLFGEQCIMASIDLVRVDGRAVRWDYWRKTASDLNAVSWIREVERIGAGEILLNFPERDGVGQGMDLEIIQEAVCSTRLPVLALGGISTPAHAVECFRAGKPSGIGVGNSLAHFEQSILLFKKALAQSGVPMRTGVKASYSDSPTDEFGRPIKKPDKMLADLLFQRIVPEEI